MASFILLALPLVAHATTTNLATVTPCPDCPSEVSHAPVTVTKQFQVVSTCSASTTKVGGTLYRYYPCEPSTWVSTVVPTIFNGQWGNTTVTQQDHKVTFSGLSSVETITSVKTATPTLRRRYQPPRLGFRAANESTFVSGGSSTGAAGALPGVITSPTVVTETQFKTHEVYNCAPLGQMGPIALPGTYEGSPVCTGAGPDERGALTQTVEVTSCLDHACTVTSQTWIQEPTATVTHGTTTTVTLTRTVGADTQPTGTTCSSFRLKAVRDNTKFHHGNQGYLSFPGAEGVLDGKKEAGSFSLDGTGTLAVDGKHVCAARSGPLAKTQRACRGSWTLNEDGSVSYSARNDIAFCFAKDKTVFSRNANRSGCKPVKFVAECVGQKQGMPQAPAGVQPLPQQTPGATAPTYPGAAAPGDNAPDYGGGAAASPAPGGSPPSYDGGAASPAPGGEAPSYVGGGGGGGSGSAVAAPSPAPGDDSNNTPSYGGGSASPAPGDNNTPSYGGGSASPAPGDNTPSYGGSDAPAPAPGSDAPSYGGDGAAPAEPGNNGPTYGGGSPAPGPGNNGGTAPAYGGASGAPQYPADGGSGVPAPGQSTTCTESLGAEPTAQPPAYNTGAPAAPSYGNGSVPVYGTGSPLPQPTTTMAPTTTTTSCSTSLTDMPTGPTRTTTKKTKTTSLTDMPTGPTRTTTTTDMSADPSAADPTSMPSALRFEALGARLMARGDEDALDEGDVGQKARRHHHQQQHQQRRRARGVGRAAWW